MGIEYRISCSPESLPKLQEFLRRAGGQQSVQFPEQVEFRFHPSTSGEMPDATAILEAQGLYDHCGAPGPVAVLFRRIIDEALKLSDSSDSVIVTSL